MGNPTLLKKTLSYSISSKVPFWLECYLNIFLTLFLLENESQNLESFSQILICPLITRESQKSRESQESRSSLKKAYNEDATMVVNTLNKGTLCYMLQCLIRHINKRTSRILTDNSLISCFFKIELPVLYNIQDW